MDIDQCIEPSLEFYNPADAATACGCCTASVKRIADQLHLPIIRTIGGVRLFTSQQVAKIKNERERRQIEAWR